MGDNVKCPHCKHIFDSEESSGWAPDENGHPTVETITCPKCSVGTEPLFDCSCCPGSLAGSENECLLEEQCSACVSYDFDEFEVVHLSDTKE